MAFITLYEIEIVLHLPFLFFVKILTGKLRSILTIDTFIPV